MAKIQGITIELSADASGISDALKDVDKASSKTTKELGQINKALKFDPDNAVLLQQKMEVLGDAISNTTTRLSALREAQADLDRQMASGQSVDPAQYRALAREIEQTEGVLRGFQRQANDTKIRLNADVDTSSLDKAKTKLKELGTAAKEAGREIGNNLATGAAAGTAAIGALVMGSTELNSDLARLRTNAEMANQDLNLVEDAFKQITAVTGETDSAVETVSNLLASGFKDNQLQTVIEGINGAAIKFSDTLNTEGIADGIQETFATGEAIGMFAELLERSGVDLEAFNEKLAVAKKNGTEADLALRTMSELGLTDVSDKYKEMNPELVKNAEATANMQLALADLAILLTPLVTMVADFTTKLVEWATANPELVTTLGIVVGAIAAVSGVFMALSPVVSGLVALWPVLTAAIGAISGPIGLAVAAFALIGVGLVAAYKHSETFRDGISTIFNAVKDIAVNVFTAVSSFVQDKISEIKKFWDENGKQISQAFENVFNAIKKVVEAVMPVVKSIVEGVIDAIKNVIDGGLNFIMGLVKTFSGLFTGDFKGMWEGIKQMFSGAVEAIWGIVNLGFVGKILKVVKGFGDSAIKFITDMVGKMKGKFDEVVSAAATKFSDLKNKILTPIQSAKDTIKGIVDQIKGFFSGLSLKIPDIKLPKLPKFNLTGDFSLNPPSVPKLSVSWNALGGIFNKPTILQSRAGLQGVKSLALFVRNGKVKKWLNSVKAKLLFNGI